MRVADGYPGAGGEVTAVGNLAGVQPGEHLRLTGRWRDHARWGRQLEVESCLPVAPSTIAGMERYLGSGLVKGIGPELAARIVRRFGTATFEVLDTRPGRLAEVEGIGRVRVARIREAWKRQRDIREVMVFLQGHGITAALAVRIWKRYGSRAPAVLRENPYVLAEEVAGHRLPHGRRHRAEAGRGRGRARAPGGGRAARAVRGRGRRPRVAAARQPGRRLREAHGRRRRGLPRGRRRARGPGCRRARGERRRAARGSPPARGARAGRGGRRRPPRSGASRRRPRGRGAVHRGLREIDGPHPVRTSARGGAGGVHEPTPRHHRWSGHRQDHARARDRRRAAATGPARAALRADRDVPRSASPRPRAARRRPSTGCSSIRPGVSSGTQAFRSTATP